MPGKLSADMLRAVKLMQDQGLTAAAAAQATGVSVGAIYSSRPYREWKKLPPTKYQQRQK